VDGKKKKEGYIIVLVKEDEICGKEFEVDLPIVGLEIKERS
jgi:hypothetical protein